MALNSNWNEQATTTLNLWASKDFADAFSSHNPLWWMMRKNSTLQTGGLGIKALEPMKYFDSNGPQVEGVADAYTELIPSATTGWTNAEYAWCEKRLSVSIEQLTLDQQGSDTSKIDYLSTVKDISMDKFMEALATDIWRAEGATGVNGQSRLYLGSILCYLNRGGSSTTSTVNSIILPHQTYAGTEGGVTVGGAAVGTTPLTNPGNIERNGPNGALWCTPILNPTNTDTTSLDVFNNAYDLTIRGKDHCDLIVTTRRNFGSLMSILQGYQRFTGDSALAQAGFEAIKFRGAEVVFDDRIPGGNALFLNTTKIKLRCGSMKPVFELKPDPYRTIVNWQARWVGQLTSGMLGRLHARHANVGV